MVGVPEMVPRLDTDSPGGSPVAVNVYCQFGNYLRIRPGNRKLNANGRALFANGSPLQAIGAKRWNY